MFVEAVRVLAEAVRVTVEAVRVLLEAVKVIIEAVRRLTQIPTPYRVYLIDTGKEGRARDSRPPQPHPPVDLFLTGGRDESR